MIILTYHWFGSLHGPLRIVSAPKAMKSGGTRRRGGRPEWRTGLLSAGRPHRYSVIQPVTMPVPSELR